MPIRIHELILWDGNISTGMSLPDFFRHIVLPSGYPMFTWVGDVYAVYRHPTDPNYFKLTYGRHGSPVHIDAFAGKP